jgi:hypothetical protein
MSQRRSRELFSLRNNCVAKVKSKMVREKRNSAFHLGSALTKITYESTENAIPQFRSSDFVISRATHPTKAFPPQSIENHERTKIALYGAFYVVVVGAGCRKCALSRRRL